MMKPPYIGVDGCKAGWFWVGLGSGDGYSLGVADSIRDLLKELTDPKLVLVDIPIGLRTDSEEERVCDKRAREALGRPRGSSVFPAPCRPAVYASDLNSASQVNKAKTGRGLSRQAVNLIPKIREVDTLLQESPEAREVVREIHPELCFWALNGREAMTDGKKNPEGLLERLEILTSFDDRAGSVAAEALLGHPRSVVARDDVLDALAAAVTASHSNALRTLPETPERDQQGIPMEMVYWNPYEGSEDAG